ncbi:DUF6165 family protein [Yoonia sp. 208BN28-4]|uniref:DUF6165 family protein n=1 Tax=Yoonia sp. 208BN28-4 TaxID=3126505 RepID=UPI0030A432CF
MNDILTPIAPGELIDKLTILRLKTENISDPAKLANVRHEQDVLQKVADAAIPPSDDLTRLWAELYRINGDLWVIEDDIRKCEGRNDFGPAFIALARAVYVTNDERASVKKQINLLLGSDLIEEKSYYSPKDTA